MSRLDCFSLIVPFVGLLTLAILAKMGSASSQMYANATEWPVQNEEGLYMAYKDGGKWVNWWARGRPGIFSFLSRVATMKDLSNIPDSIEALNEALPVREPYWTREPSSFGQPGIRATWLGHASVLAEVDGVSILTDPIFSERASMFQWAGPKRYRPPACTVNELPESLDAVVISHSHYDHLDYYSCLGLQQRYGDRLHWFVPSGIGAFLRDSIGVSASQVHDMVWWQEEPLPGTNVTMAFTPNNHWSRRGLMDENDDLWGSWSVLGPKHKFWFGGDTGYCNGFAQIGQKYGPFDLSAIPIGAYYPRWFMKWVHVDPSEAISMHKDLRSKKSLGIHWGTFKLTKEYYLEPKEAIQELALQDPLVGEEAFLTVNIGDTLEG